MNNIQRERVQVLAILYTEAAVRSFMENTQNYNSQALAETLKHWANPQGAYKELPEIAASKELEFLQTLLAHPERILSTLDAVKEDKEEILILLRFQIDQIAECILKERNLHIDVSSQSKLDAWWKDHSKNRADFTTQFQQLTKQQQNNISEQNANIPLESSSNYYLFATMCNHMSLLSAETLLGSAKLREMSYHAVKNIGQSAVHHAKETGNKLGGRGILAFFAVVGIAIVAGFYAMKKAYNSARNIIAENKIIRSAFRLVGTGGGAAGGAVVGAKVGAVAGTAVMPGPGTLAGAAFFALIGAFIGSGAGAFLTKWIAKGISYLVHRGEFNPTNPEKYQLTEFQEGQLLDNNLNPVAVTQMLQANKSEKDKLGIYSSVPFTQANAEKKLSNILNQLLHLGEVKQPIYIDGKLHDPAAFEVETVTVEAIMMNTSYRYLNMEGIADLRSQSIPSEKVEQAPATAAAQTTPSVQPAPATVLYPVDASMDHPLASPTLR